MLGHQAQDGVQVGRDRVVEGDADRARQLLLDELGVEVLDRDQPAVDQPRLLAGLEVGAVRAEADEARAGAVVEGGLDGARVEAALATAEDDAAEDGDAVDAPADQPGRAGAGPEDVVVDDRPHAGRAGLLGHLEGVGIAGVGGQDRPGVDVAIDRAAQQLVGQLHRPVVEGLGAGRHGGFPRRGRRQVGRAMAARRWRAVSHGGRAGRRPAIAHERSRGHDRFALLAGDC